MIGAAFTCNICGHAGHFDPVGDWREAPSCDGCGSSVRMRSMIHYLLDGLLGRSPGLAGLKRRRTTGVGLSDWEGYAAPLSRAFAYTNTFYHQAPRLDICAPGKEHLGKYDFLMSSDVFEHVPPPASRAFDNAFALLRAGGLLVLTVPFADNPDTIEHYPDLRSFAVVELDGEWVVVARSADGSLALHTNPVFHGGPGSTLELRLFSRAGVIADLAAAGFVDIEVHGGAVPEWGVFPPHHHGLPITARKPASAIRKLLGRKLGAARPN